MLGLNVFQKQEPIYLAEYSNDLKKYVKSCLTTYNKIIALSKSSMIIMSFSLNTFKSYLGFCQTRHSKVNISVKYYKMYTNSKYMYWWSPISQYSLSYYYNN